MKTKRLKENPQDTEELREQIEEWRSPQLLMAANQEATRSWWEEEREKFVMYISEPVVQEISAGDSEAAQRRLETIRDVAELAITEEVNELAKELIAKLNLPQKARMDALHIATATIHGMDYLLTWNCRHIANATLRKTMSMICEQFGYELPVICTPLELLTEDKDDEG